MQYFELKFYTDISFSAKSNVVQQKQWYVKGKGAFLDLFTE